jgi:hypothetical protein
MMALGGKSFLFLGQRMDIVQIRDFCGHQVFATMCRNKKP